MEITRYRIAEFQHFTQIFLHKCRHFKILILHGQLVFAELNIGFVKRAHTLPYVNGRDRRNKLFIVQLRTKQFGLGKKKPIQFRRLFIYTLSTTIT